MKEEPLYRCTVCGRVGTVGRCCGLETREPLTPECQPERSKPTQSLPLEPTPAMIEAGAQRLVHWRDEDSRWPEDWDEWMVVASRNDAERVWRSMWLSAQETSNES